VETSPDVGCTRVKRPLRLLAGGVWREELEVQMERSVVVSGAGADKDAELCLSSRFRKGNELPTQTVSD